MGAMQNPRAGGGRKWRSDAMDGPNMLPCLSASEHVNLAKFEPSVTTGWRLNFEA
jgi:hypothetical protein